MSRTEIDGDQILDHTVQKKDIDVSTVGQSLITLLQISGAGLTMNYTGADSGTGIVELILNSGGFGTDYFPFSKSVEQVDTADGWVQYDLVTTATLDAGIYVIHFVGSVTNTSKKQVGFQVNWRPNTDPWTEIHASYNPPALANVYETRSAFKEVTLLTPDTISVQVNFGQTTGGGTGKINSHDIYLFKVAELP